MVAVLVAGAAGLIGLGGPIGAELNEVATDLPDGTPANPAAPTDTAMTSLKSMLGNDDVDAFQICVTDPAALHLSVGGVNEAGEATNLDTVMWLFDANGTMLAVNDDRSGVDRGSVIVPGQAAASPGLHTVAIGYFRTKPYAADGTRILEPGQGPLDHWDPGFGVHNGYYVAHLLGGATGSVGCGDTGHAVMTGNGRCQVLGGEASGAGKAKGLDKAAEHRRNETC
jgi:hypothetical protein